MVPSLRKQYNQTFTDETFRFFLNELNAQHGEILFRVAETPIFVPKDFKDKMIETCEHIVDVILQPDFKEKTNRAIPADLDVPNETAYPHFIAFDFGICENEKGELEPQLIEMQAFPTLFAYEVMLDDVFGKHFSIPENYSSYMNGLNRERYLDLLKKIIVHDHDPKHVILLEVFPEKQKTNIDFYCTEDYLGIKAISITDIIKKGNQLFYKNENAEEVLIKRIYNRMIFDDVQQQEQWVKDKAAVLFDDLEVEWVSHPNWFYRVSKYTIPLLSHTYIPQTSYLNEIKDIPADLENYVLKPLFSFAGQGVIIDVKKEDIGQIPDPENWILQRKVNYAAVIKTPDEPAKAEIRIFYFWEEGTERPVAVNNLARLSKGKMIGVRYNKDKICTGGSFCLFEKD